MPVSPAPFRAPHIDTLRGIAVFGILLVNIWSFVWGFESLRYGVLPAAASLYDRVAVFMVAFIAEQKFYPIFAFLFGAGFALHTRALKRRLGTWQRVRKTYRRRLAWLVGCGVLHGTLIWFGDILTVYGIAGFFLLPFAGARLRKVRMALWIWSAAWIVLIVLNVLTALPLSDDDVTRALGISLIDAAQQARAVYTEGTVAEVAWRRLNDYASVSLQSVLLLPHLMVLFLLGTLSIRLGWLIRPWRHRALWRRVRSTGFALGIPFSLLWAWLALDEAINPLLGSPHLFTAFALLPLGGSLLAAAYVASLMLAGIPTMRHLGNWLAPVGRMALTNYLSQSVLCVILLQSVGLGLGAKLAPAQLILIAIMIMVLQVVVSRWWLARNKQGPIEILYRRHADAGID
ncbi:MAG: DUF418 domain-containing protein [Pseudomonadota bacterium]